MNKDSDISPEEAAAAAQRSLRRITKGSHSGGNRQAAKHTRSGRDPELLGDVVDRLVTEQGWQQETAIATLTNSWESIVGSDVANHCAPAGFDGGTLRIAAESTAWATQLNLLKGTLFSKIETAIGVGIVTKITIIGPQAPRWSRGAWRVAGRGPRDTYG